MHEREAGMLVDPGVAAEEAWKRAALKATAARVVRGHRQILALCVEQAALTRTQHARTFLRAAVQGRQVQVGCCLVDLLARS